MPHDALRTDWESSYAQVTFYIRIFHTTYVTYWLGAAIVTVEAWMIQYYCFVFALNQQGLMNLTALG